MEKAPSLVGTTIQGRYHLVRLLGDGGMGSVFKAADQVLRRFVAVKLLHPSTAQNPSAVERFIREARAAASIGHPNIIDILDFGMEDGRPFLVMEYLRGRSLSQAIAHESPFTIERACSIATHSLAGLAAAHDRGILHRDLKPANLMLISQFGDRDFVKLCDFGFATLLTPKQSVSDGKTLTPARTLVGTPAYAAPERLRGDDKPDPRMDVYSIGVVLYEMLAGRRPFDAPTFAELAQKVKTMEPPPLRKIRPDLPKPLEDVVLRSLSKQREQRWATAEEFAAALVPFGGRRVARGDDSPSDSLTMDLLRLRARETSHRLRLSMIEGENRDPAGRSRRAVLASPEVPRPRSESAADIPVDIDVSLEEELVSTGNLDIKRLHQATVPAEQLREGRTSPSVQMPKPSRDTSKNFEVPAPATIPPGANVREVSGQLVLALMRHVATRFTARALKDVLSGMPEAYQPIFRRGVTENDWVPFEAYAGMQIAVDTKHGRDDMQLVVQCGRAAGDAAVPVIRELVKTPAPPEVLLAEMPQITSRLIHGITLRVRGIGRGYGSLELLDSDHHDLTTCVSMLGFIDRCFGECSAKELEVNSVSCRALGDEQCVFDLSWLA